MSPIVVGPIHRCAGQIQIVQAGLHKLATSQVSRMSDQVYDNKTDDFERFGKNLQSWWLSMEMERFCIQMYANSAENKLVQKAFAYSLYRSHHKFYRCELIYKAFTQR